MRSSATAEFWRHFAALPPSVRQSTQKAYRLWVQNPGHRSLRFKKTGAVWSVRVSRGYRALGSVKGDTVYWFWIGPHDEYQRLIRERGP